MKSLSQRTWNDIHLQATPSRENTHFESVMAINEPFVGGGVKVWRSAGEMAE